MDPRALQEYVREITRAIYAQREELLRAFIAETGLLPSEVEQIEQIGPQGVTIYRVQRREGSSRSLPAKEDL